MEREIVYYPDPVLAKKAKEIEEITPELKELVDDMIVAMYKYDGIGLAAPQVGESIRLVVVDITGPKIKEDLRVMLNPVITASEGKVETQEGCLSVREYRAKVKRAEFVTVEYMDMDGKQQTVEADDLLAICLQHEIDHLNGVLFIDHISRLKRTFYDKKVKKWEKLSKTDPNA